MTREEGIEPQAVSDAEAQETEELIRQASAGDLDAFDRLFVRYGRKVLRLAYHMVGNPDEAADVAQEVFVRIFKYLKKIRDARKFSTWMYRLVVHASYDHLRRHRMNGWVPLDEPNHRSLSETLADDAVSIEEDVVTRDLSDKLLECLEVLSPSERSVFVLRDIQGLEVKEIASIQEISRITVRRHLSTARHKLREVARKLDMNAFRSRAVS